MIGSIQRIKATRYSLLSKIKPSSNTDGAGISVGASTNPKISSSAKAIPQRKTPIEQRSARVNYNLIAAQDTITAKLSRFELDITTAVKENITNYLTRYLSKVTDFSSARALANVKGDLLIALKTVKDYIPELKIKINERLLLNKSTLDLIQDTSKAAKVSAETTGFLLEHEKLVGILFSMLDDLSELADEGINIASSINLARYKTLEKKKIMGATMARELFASTLPLYKKLTFLSKEIKKERELDAIEKQRLPQESGLSYAAGGASSAAEESLSGDFLAESRVHLRSILLNTAEELLSSIRIIDNFYNITFS